MNADIGLLKSPITKAALEYWSAARGHRLMPARADLAPDHMVGIIPNMLLMDVLQEPLDFRYRLIGTRIEEFMAKPYTGKCLSEIPHQAPPSQIWTDCLETVETRAPRLSGTPYVGPKKDIVTPEALLLPLSEDNHTVNILMVVVDYFGRASSEARLPGS